MPIILNQEEESLKYDLLKLSLKDEADYKMNKNYSFSNPKDTSYYSKFNHKSFGQQISDWNSNSVTDIKGKKKISRFALPEMKNRKRNQVIEDLSRELLKYEQFNLDQINEHNKFRLSFLKQMTKVNFKKEKPKETESPKKIDIKLQFPERYEKYRLENEDSKKSLQYEGEIEQGNFQMQGSFYSKRPSRGLIPSIKKLVSSSFPKKSMFRSESERQPYQHKKLFINKNDWQTAKKSITQQLQQKFLQQQRLQRQKKVRLARIERRLPINFLSYSHRKQSGQRQPEQPKTETQRKRSKKSPYLSHLPNSSYYPKMQKLNEEQMYQNRRLSECLHLNRNKKKSEPQQN